jgi:hypothetical protein
MGITSEDVHCRQANWPTISLQNYIYRGMSRICVLPVLRMQVQRNPPSYASDVYSRNSPMMNLVEGNRGTFVTTLETCLITCRLFFYSEVASSRLSLFRPKFDGIGFTTNLSPLPLGKDSPNRHTHIALAN